MQRFAPPFESFLAPARAHPEAWRLGLGICVAIAVYLGGGYAIARGFSWAVAPINFDTHPIEGTLFLLLSFLAMAAAPMVAARLVHRQSIASLFGRAPRVLHDFVWALGVAALVFALAFLPWLIWITPLPGLAPALWLQLLPLVLIGVLLQTGAEELLFRGYLQQHLAARYAAPLVWMIAPSLVFGALHFTDEAPLSTGLAIMGAAALFGVIAADLTARTGSIGAAWGLHFANNIIAIALFGTAGPLGALALYLTPFTLANPIMPWLLLSDAATLLVVWVILRRVLAR